MAIIPSKKAVIKDGSEVLVRVGEISDAPQILANGQHFIERGEGQVLTPGEGISIFTEQAERGSLTQVILV